MDSNPADDNTLPEASEALLQEAEALIWALLDDEIQPTDAKRLEGLIQDNEQVRQRYINCTQMHVDLVEHFGGGATEEPTESSKRLQSPVLGSLGDLRPGTDSLPPVAE